LNRANAAIAVEVADCDQEARAIGIAVKIRVISFEEHEVKREERSENESQEVWILVPLALRVHVNFVTVDISAAFCEHGPAAVWLQLAKAGDVSWRTGDVALLVTGGDEEICVRAKFCASSEEGRSVDDSQRRLVAIGSTLPVNDELCRAPVADLLFNLERT